MTQSSLTRKQLLMWAAGTALFLTLASGARAWWWSSDDKEPTGPITELTWEDLIPADFEPPENPFETMSQEDIDQLLDGSDESNRRLAEYDDMMSYAPTNEALNAKRVKLPGYVVPLDFDGQTSLEEFLLVPYFGACIHTPPPPANQVVHAEARKAVTVDDPYLPIWAIGTLEVDTVKSDLGEAGYRLRIESIEPYEKEP